MGTNFRAATSQDQFESPKGWDVFPVQQLRAGTSPDKRQGLSSPGLYASDGDLLVAQQLSQSPWAAPALRSDPVRVQRMFRYLEVGWEPASVVSGFFSCVNFL